MNVVELTLLDAFEIVLELCVGVRKRVGELIDIVFAIEAKSEGHHIVLPMVRTTIVEDISSGQTLPSKYSTDYKENFDSQLIYQRLRLLDLTNGVIPSRYNDFALEKLTIWKITL